MASEKNIIPSHVSTYKECVFFFTILVSVLLLVITTYSKSIEPMKLLNNPGALLEKIKENSNKINTLQASFVQEKSLSILSKNIVSKGKFWFQKPSSLRWEYTTPYRYAIIFHDNNPMIIDEGHIVKHGLGSSKIFREINSILTGALNGNIIQSDTDFEKYFYETESFWMVKLFPLNDNMKEFIKHINVYFHNTDYSVYKTMIVEPTDDYTVITFSERIINEKIPSNVFVVN